MGNTTGFLYRFLQMFGQIYCTIPVVSVGIRGSGSSISKMLKFYVKISLSDGQGTVRCAFLMRPVFSSPASNILL